MTSTRVSIELSKCYGSVPISNFQDLLALLNGLDNFPFKSRDKNTIFWAFSNSNFCIFRIKQILKHFHIDLQIPQFDNIMMLLI